MNELTEIEYWKHNYEKAMGELEKAQLLLKETHEKLRELERLLYGGHTR